MLGARFAPFQNLTAHYLLAGSTWRAAHDDPPRDHADLDDLRELWEAFEAEIGGPPWAGRPGRRSCADVERHVRGTSRSSRRGGRAGIGLLGFDVRRGRGSRTSSERLRATRAETARRPRHADAPRRRPCPGSTGTTTLELDVLASNHDALAVYERLGFVEYQRRARRLARRSRHSLRRPADRGRPSAASTCRPTTRRGSRRRSRSSCPGSAAPSTRTSRRRGTAGSRSTTSSATRRDLRALRRLARSSRTAPSASCSRSARGGPGRPLRHCSTGARRRRVPLGARVLRAAAARRRDRARHEPDRRRPPDRSRRSRAARGAPARPTRPPSLAARARSSTPQLAGACSG